MITLSSALPVEKHPPFHSHHFHSAVHCFTYHWTDMDLSTRHHFHPTYFCCAVASHHPMRTASPECLLLRLQMKIQEWFLDCFTLQSGTSWTAAALQPYSRVAAENGENSSCWAGRWAASLVAQLVWRERFQMEGPTWAMPDDVTTRESKTSRQTNSIIQKKQKQCKE